MKKPSYCYEILLGEKSSTPADWQDFLQQLQNQLPELCRWRLRVVLQDRTLHYYLLSPVPLSLGLNHAVFLLRSVEPNGQTSTHFLSDTARLIRAQSLYLNRWHQNLIDLIHRLAARQSKFHGLEFYFRSFAGKTYTTAYLYHAAARNSTKSSSPVIRRSRLLLPDLGNLLSIDFRQAADFGYTKIPKYLSTDKLLPLLSPSAEAALFTVPTFPYNAQSSYLSHQAYDFARHSLIIGSSGSGKSKLIALLIRQIHATDAANYRIVVIDPHDALRQDLGGIDPCVLINFATSDSSVDLFQNQIAALSVSVELTLGLFRSIFAEAYNGRLERVLRYSLFLLISAQAFSFTNLRQLLTDPNYRSQLLRDYSNQLPVSVSQFFLTDFSELKTQSYAEAIAPIIAFIDEMQMVPIFNQTAPAPHLSDIIQDNFLSVFSLNRLRLGDKVTRVIAGLLAQQLFLLAERRAAAATNEFLPHLMIIIDEVSLVESPILARALSELRKYNVSIILAGQYFHQISANLRESILTNVANYYLFRLSQTDADLLVDHLQVKLARSVAREDRLALLTGMKTRECLVRITRDGKFYPTFIAQTCDAPDFPMTSNLAEDDASLLLPLPATPTTVFHFDFDVDIGAKDIMLKNTTSRKKYQEKTL